MTQNQVRFNAVVRLCVAFWLAITGLMAFGQARAAVHVQATRVVYSGDDASASVALRNNSTLPYLVQTWLDTGDASSMPENLPMTLTPPLMRLAPGEEAVVRAIYSGSGLPQDKESLFWINIQEIPPASSATNALQIAIRTRIKLFYRPSQLKMSLDEAARSLKWHMDGPSLIIRNPSPLHITFAYIQNRQAGKAEAASAIDMIKPGETLAVPARGLDLGKSGQLAFGYINDYGGVSEVKDALLERK